MPNKGLLTLLATMTVLMMITLGVVIAMATGVFTPPGMHQAEPAEETSPEQADLADADYYELEPSLTVNLADDEPARYLEAEIEIATTDSEVREALERHEAAIRDELMLMLAEQTFSDLSDAEQREMVREEALRLINGILDEHGVSGEAAGIYFTRFVMQ